MILLTAEMLFICVFRSSIEACLSKIKVAALLFEAFVWRLSKTALLLLFRTVTKTVDSMTLRRDGEGRLYQWI